MEALRSFLLSIVTLVVAIVFEKETIAVLYKQQAAATISLSIPSMHKSYR